LLIKVVVGSNDLEVVYCLFYIWFVSSWMLFD